MLPPPDWTAGVPPALFPDGSNDARPLLGYVSPLKSRRDAGGLGPAKAAVGPVFGVQYQSGFDGIIVNIVNDPSKMLLVANIAVEVVSRPEETASAQ